MTHRHCPLRAASACSSDGVSLSSPQVSSSEDPSVGLVLPISPHYLVAFQSSSRDPTASRSSHMVLSISFPPASTKHCPTKAVVASGGKHLLGDPWGSWLLPLSHSAPRHSCVHAPMATEPPNPCWGVLPFPVAPSGKAGFVAPHPSCANRVWTQRGCPKDAK